MTDIYPYGQVAHVTYQVPGIDGRQNSITARVMRRDESPFYEQPNVVMVLEISQGAPLPIRRQQDPAWEIVQRPITSTDQSPTSATDTFWV